MPDTTCLYTHVKNVSGASRHFGWLPPHGKTLAAAQTVTIFGDVHDRLNNGGRLNLRKSAALEADLLANRVEIIRTPTPTFYDVSAGTVKQVGVSGGSVAVVDPCYGSYTGSA